MLEEFENIICVYKKPRYNKEDEAEQKIILFFCSVNHKKICNKKLQIILTWLWVCVCNCVSVFCIYVWLPYDWLLCIYMLWNFERLFFLFWRWYYNVWRLTTTNIPWLQNTTTTLGYKKKVNSHKKCIAW